MKLYEIPKGSKVLLPITDGKSESMELCTFNNVDGAYSHITTSTGQTVHLSRLADLKKRRGYYVLREDTKGE